MTALMMMMICEDEESGMISFWSDTAGTNMSNRERVTIQHLDDDDDDDNDFVDDDDGIHQSRTPGQA